MSYDRYIFILVMILDHQKPTFKDNSTLAPKTQSKFVPNNYQMIDFEWRFAGIFS